jgi:arginine exporter protein ArgO
VNVLGAVGLGLGLGVVTGLPLGVVNVAVADAAAATQKRYAIGLGIGGALADTTHSLLAFIGVGRLVTERPDLVRILAVVAGVAIAIYAVVAWRRHRRRITARAITPGASVTPRSLLAGIPAGLALTLPNPGALTAWVAIAATLWPHAQPAEAIALGLGVGAGSAAWFAVLAHLVSRVRIDHPVLRRLPLVAIVMFVAIAIAGIVRAL